MSKQEHNAKKIKIMDMLDGFPSLAGANTDGLIDAMATACADCGVNAVAMACQRFSRGEVSGRNNAFPPTGAELAEQASMLDRILNRVTVKDGLVSYRIGELPPPGMEPAGLKTVEIGGRLQDVTGMSIEEQDAAIRTGKIPDSVTSRIEGPDARAVDVRPRTMK